MRDDISATDASSVEVASDIATLPSTSETPEGASDDTHEYETESYGYDEPIEPTPPVNTVPLEAEPPVVTDSQPINHSTPGPSGDYMEHPGRASYVSPYFTDPFMFYGSYGNVFSPPLSSYPAQPPQHSLHAPMQFPSQRAAPVGSAALHSLQALQDASMGAPDPSSALNLGDIEVSDRIAAGHADDQRALPAVTDTPRNAFPGHGMGDAPQGRATRSGSGHMSALSPSFTPQAFVTSARYFSSGMTPQDLLPGSPIALGGPLGTPQIPGMGDPSFPGSPLQFVVRRVLAANSPADGSRSPHNPLSPLQWTPTG
jgi:hypothetical protein